MYTEINDFLHSVMKRGCECSEMTSTQCTAEGKWVASENYFSLLMLLGTPSQEKKKSNVEDMIK